MLERPAPNALSLGSPSGNNADITAMPPSPAKWGTGDAGDTEKDNASDNYFNVSFWRPTLDWFEKKVE
jgi:hypothetical protein